MIHENILKAYKHYIHFTSFSFYIVFITRRHNMSIHTYAARAIYIYHNFDAFICLCPCLCLTHSAIASTSSSISARVFPACRHTRTRSLPLGTVGAMMARTTSPRCWQWLAKSRGYGVRREKMGEWSWWSTWRSERSAVCSSSQRVRR